MTIFIVSSYLVLNVRFRNSKFKHTINYGE
nr:MAG TPA: hypothetical protein [Caudoviricetes sp.]